MSKNLQVDFTTILRGLDNKPLKERSGVESVKAALLEAGVSTMMLDSAIGMLRAFWGTGGEPKEIEVTAQAACMQALQMPDQALGGADRVVRMRLALKLLDPKQPVDVDEKERETILKAVEKAYASPVVYFRINEMFEAAVVERDRPRAANVEKAA